MRLSGDLVRKSEVRASVKAFIQNVHHFRDEGLRDVKPPPEHVVIFDEAQRAWNARQTANFLKTRKGITGVNFSEPELLVSYMDRLSDWAVVVCLVGGGQEINTGEAGIDAWLEAIQSKFTQWHMFISSRLTDSEYAAGRALENARKLANCHFDDSLHLAVSMRSFRAENVSAFVKALIDCEIAEARRNLRALSDSYPIVLSRGWDYVDCVTFHNQHHWDIFDMVTSMCYKQVRLNLACL